MDLNEGFFVKLSRWEHLEQDSKDLQKAKRLIARLRAENQILKDEKKRFAGVIDATMRHISIAGNPLKKYGVALVKSQLQKARLI